MSTMTRLSPEEKALFLKEVRYALDVELDPDDAIGHELDEYYQAEADANANKITPAVLSVARQLLAHVPAEWLAQGTHARPRWQRLLREHGIAVDC